MSSKLARFFTKVYERHAASIFRVEVSRAKVLTVLRVGKQKDLMSDEAIRAMERLG